MKKKVLLIMGLCLLLLVGGCSKKDASNISGDSDKGSNEASATGAPVKEEYKVNDYITLGKYKGIEVSVNKVLVTDAAVEEAIASDLESNKALEEITDRDVVQNGDFVNIDYEGLKDGVAFEGGTATGSDLEIGSGRFIPGFEEGLIDKKVGEKVELDLTFPEEYTNSDGSASDLAGQAVVFNVTINKIQEYVTPELTEDYVKDNTDYDSVDAYKKGMRENLTSEYETSYDNEKTQKIIDAIISDSEISSYPQTLVDYYSTSYKNYISQMLYYSYGMTVEQYISAIGSTQEEFDANAKTVAENYSSVELVQRAIAKAEDMKITNEEYDKQIDSYLTDYNVETEEDLLAIISKDQIKDDMLLKKALQFAIDNAIVSGSEVTPTPIINYGPTVTPEATVTPAAK